MGFFNFIENFFFLSLAITFVLILLLVYHFKQRITSLEQKNDTMFEIANGLVKEVGAMKAYILNTMSTQMNYPFSSVSLHKVNEMNSDHDVVEEEQDEDEEDEEDEDEEDDDDIAGEEYGDDEDDEDDDDIAGEEYEGEEDVNVEEINDIYVEDNDAVIIHDIDETNEDEEELKIVEVTLSETENGDLDTKEKDSEKELKVNKIETEPSSVNDIQAEHSTKPDLDSYKKMNVNQLKAFIIEKGYTTDFKNLKRNDLIKIIEDNESK
jgi:hypothetical protein